MIRELSGDIINMSFFLIICNLFVGRMLKLFAEQLDVANQIFTISTSVVEKFHKDVHTGSRMSEDSRNNHVYSRLSYYFSRL